MNIINTRLEQADGTCCCCGAAIKNIVGTPMGEFGQKCWSNIEKASYLLKIGWDVRLGKSYPSAEQWKVATAYRAILHIEWLEYRSRVTKLSAANLSKMGI